MSHQKVDLFQISQDTTPSKRPTRTPRNKYLKTNRIINLFLISMLLLHGLNQTAATTVVQTNVTQFIHGQQQQSTSVFYLTLSPKEEKTKIQTKINLLNVTYENKSTNMTDISTLITYSLSFNQIQSCNSNSSYSTPPTHQDIQQTVPNSPTNVHNHVPSSVKSIKLHSLHTKNNHQHP